MKFSATSFQFACDLVLGAARELPLVHAVPRETAGRSPSSSSARASASRHTRTRGPKLASARMQSVVGLVERLDVGHVEAARWSSGTWESGVKSGVPRQRAIEVVRPRVIRTLEEAGDVPRARADLRAAVAADVVERPQLTRPVTTDDHRAAGDVDDEEVAGIAAPRRPRTPAPRSCAKTCSRSSSKNSGDV